MLKLFRLPILLAAFVFVVAMLFLRKQSEPGSDSPSTYAINTSSDELSEKQLDQLNIDVRLLLAENCFKCHNSTKHKAELILDTQEGIFEGGENGEVIIPGNSAESELIRRVKLSSRNEDAMPPEGDRLDRDEISLLSLWINEGAHWADTTLKLFREAPITLSKPILPLSQSSYTSAIDRWVEIYFSQNKIKWPRSIDDRKFIRKIYLDLIGKLPSPKIVENFINNSSPNKYEKVVDLLLADDSNYTTHWLSFWNDLLRNDYTGTGFITGGRKQITEWLYCALYDNMPYDNMVRDLIDPRFESEGFIKGIQWRGVVNASQRTELQAAQNISQSLLGLNLKCASCHNSFVNNVSLDQSYAFANVFADSSLQIYQCDKPTGRYTDTRFIYPELGPIAGDTISDRLSSLAQIISSPENGRIYRTVVNRIWDHLFGRGIVTPVDDMDQMPWSQELLDWLASDFIENGYNLKDLLKKITTSQTYRLLPVDQTPDELNKENFIFRGPLIRRISAEQFIDAFSDCIYPFYSGVYFTYDLPAGNPQWIWHREIELDREVLPKPGSRFFRKKFKLRNIAQIEEIQMIATADSAYQIYINNKKIMAGNDWRTPNKTIVDKANLAENNCMAIQATNDGTMPNPAGLLITLKVRYPDQSEFIITDKEWKSTDSFPGEHWKEYNFLDTDWLAVKSYGEKGYWGYPVDFKFEDSPYKARAALVAADPFSLALGRPTRENVTTNRSDEATLLQAMMLSNDDRLADNIRRGAKLWKELTGSSSQKVKDLFLILIGREPTKKELDILEQLAIEDSQQAWEDIIWSIIMLPEFHLL